MAVKSWFTPAVSRELRATLTELESRGDGESDGLARFLAELSSPVVDAAIESPHVGWESRGDG